MTLEDLKNNKEWEQAVIVFTKGSFNKEYSEKSRSYKVNKTSNYFDGSKMGKELIGNCLDGEDEGVRLDHYLGDWKVDYCYKVK